MRPITENDRNSVCVEKEDDIIIVKHFDEGAERLEEVTIFPHHAMASFSTECVDLNDEALSFAFKSSAEAEALAEAFARMAEMMKSQGL